jgi:PAS domain S-box-containing protein
MSVIRALEQKTQKKITRYMQILFVALAFALMVIASYLFVSDIERKHLQRNVKDAILYTEASIKAYMLEPETLLGGVSETIRDIILQGDSADNVQKYIIFMNDYVKSNVEKRLIGVIGFYGFFDVYGGRFIAGEMDWNPPEGYNPQSRPWYIAAVEADGDVGVTQPYLDIKNNVVSVTFSRRIFDADKRPLGVVGLDIKIDRIRQIAVDTQFAENGYGFLLDQNMELIAHPEPFLVGTAFHDVNSNIVRYEDELIQTGHVDEVISTDYRNIESIVFLERLYNGWYMGIVTPRDKYYQSTRDMALFLIVLGVALVVTLIAILLILFRQMNKESERSQTMAHWYNSILNAIPLPITVTDAEKNWTFINAVVEKILGITLKDAVGKPCSNWGADICNTESCGIVCAKRGQNQTFFSQRGLSYQVDVATLKDLNDKTMGYIEVVQDITNMKLMTKKQADTEAANQILENILNGIDAEIYVSVPHTGELLFINNYMKKKNNIEGEYTGKLCYKLFLDENQKDVCDFCPCYKLDKEPHNTVLWELRLPTNRISRNSTRYIEWTNGRIVQIQHSVDITELINAREQAIQANKGKSDFLAKMSHEIRTPMNAILGITEIQLQDETISPDMQEALSRIYNSGYLLLGIINDILDLSKIEAGKLELMPINYDVPSLINDTVYLNIMRFDSKPIVFELNIDENIPMTLSGDELRIKQILNNLLSNAFKYTDSGKVSLSITMEPAIEASMITLVFSVRDTGQGMTREQLDKLFDEYTRFNMDANRTTEGAGLGMNIARRLVELMNGKISVESEYGKGSVFTVRLPQGKVGAEVLGKAMVENLMQFRLGRMSQMKKAPQIVREHMPYGKVLIVDDVETNLYVAKGLMSPYGLSIDVSMSGFDAIEKIKSGAVYDIIFMDHFMPKMDGIEAAKIIRGLDYTRPIVALTANALTGQSEMFMTNGFDGYISKPIDIHQLNAVINKLIRDRYPAETIEAARNLKNNVKKDAKQRQPVDTELVKLFIRDAEKSIDILETINKKQGDYGDEDIQSYVINVHAMKSALSNIGETELSASAQKLEKAGRERDTDVISKETSAFLSALRTLIKKIGPGKNSVDNEVTIDIHGDDHAWLLENLSLLRKACAEYDKKTSKDTLAQLQQKKWPRHINELLDTIAECLLHSNFTEAAKLAGDYVDIFVVKI